MQGINPSYMVSYIYTYSLVPSCLLFSTLHLYFGRFGGLLCVITDCVKSNVQCWLLLARALFISVKGNSFRTNTVALIWIEKMLTEWNCLTVETVCVTYTFSDMHLHSEIKFYFLNNLLGLLHYCRQTACVTASDCFFMHDWLAGKDAACSPTLQWLFS